MKDPAVLLYFDKFIASTNGMRAEFRAWYIDLLIYQYDKGPIPNDLDTMAGICRVLPSEYILFNQMVNQVVQPKFELTEEGYVNEVAAEILRSRKQFVDKRTRSSNIAVIVKRARAIQGVTDPGIESLKKYLFSLELEDILSFKKDENFNHLVNHLVNLYIDEVEDISINTISSNTLKEKNKKENQIQKSKHLSPADPYLLKICEAFDQNSEVLQMRVRSFLNVLINDNRFESFQEQTDAYLEFKKLSRQRVHRWTSYVTEWDSEDWISKLKKEQPNEDRQDPGSPGYKKYS